MKPSNVLIDFSWLELCYNIITLCYEVPEMFYGRWNFTWLSIRWVDNDGILISGWIFVCFWPFLALLIVQLEEGDRKQGKRGGVTRSKGTQAGNQTQVRCRASAHGSRALPTELSGTPWIYPLTGVNCVALLNRIQRHYKLNSDI